jgi:hypothetical protein
MFSRKKIAAVSGLLGGLAVACAGVSQAYAAAGPGTCTPDGQGNITCIQRIVGKAPDGDGYVVRQTQSCVPTQPMSLPVVGLLNRGNMRIGPEVTCAPSTTAAEKGESGVDLLGLLS